VRIFATYALCIFILTHWPNLKINAPIHRPDLLAHLAVFSLWMILACCCRFHGPILSARNIFWSFILTIAYAGLDEGAQYPDFVQRTAAWDDYWFDVLGVVLGTLAMTAAAILQAIRLKFNRQR